VKLKQEARVLKRKAVSSLTVATTAFNSPHDDGRVTQVLLSLQHAFEMLLKAALVQHNVPVFDRKLGRSIGFEKCLGLAAAHAQIRLSDADAGTLRAIDAMRDDEQHWFNEVSEQLCSSTTSSHRSQNCSSPVAGRDMMLALASGPCSPWRRTSAPRHKSPRRTWTAWNAGSRLGALVPRSSRA